MTTLIIALVGGVLGGFAIWLRIHAAQFDARMRALHKQCGLPGPVGTQARREREAIRGANAWFGG